MNEQRAKLIKSDNNEEEFAILLDQQIGRGAFGIVYRALDLSQKHEKLAVKIVPLENSNRQVVESQLRVLKQLSDHPNLVRVKPVKCYSENNYYIFMEYCRDGTLYNQMKTQKVFSEQEIMNVFYQTIKGYKVLYDKKILHQDLKPENVLIDNGLYKLADFGLSIFYEGYKYTNKRQGTLNYIAPQKLFKIDYKGNPLSDVYSIGVIFFEMTLGRHPYIRTHGKKELKTFIQELRQAKLSLPMGFSIEHSLEFLRFFDIIIRMLDKSQADRITFNEISNYVENSDNFELVRKQQRQKSRQIVLSDYNIIISEVSKVLTVPISTSDADEKQLREKMEQGKKDERDQHDKIIIKRLYEYIINRRIVVYFLDRLARRLAVEQMQQGKRNALYDVVIFQLLLMNRTILNHMMQEIRNPKKFTISDWKKLRVDNELKIVLQIVSRDEGYIQDSTCDFLAEESKLTKSQLKDLFQIYKDNDLNAQAHRLQKSLVNLLQFKCKLVEANRKVLTTLVFLEKAAQVVKELHAIVDKSEYLEGTMHEVETADVEQLRKRVQRLCSSNGWLTIFEIPESTENQAQMEELLK